MSDIIRIWSDRIDRRPPQGGDSAKDPRYGFAEVTSAFAVPVAYRKKDLSEWPERAYRAYDPQAALAELRTMTGSAEAKTNLIATGRWGPVTSKWAAKISHECRIRGAGVALGPSLAPVRERAQHWLADAARPGIGSGESLRNKFPALLIELEAWAKWPGHESATAKQLRTAVISADQDLQKSPDAGVTYRDRLLKQQLAIEAYSDARELARLKKGDGGDLPVAILERIAGLETKIAERTDRDARNSSFRHYATAYQQAESVLQTYPQSRHDTDIAAELAVVWQALADADDEVMRRRR